MLILHPLCHTCYMTLFNQLRPSGCYPVCLPVSLSLGSMEYKSVFSGNFRVCHNFQYTHSISTVVWAARVRLQTNMLKGMLRNFYWRSEWAQRFGDHCLHEMTGGISILKDFCTANIHYFVQGKLRATNTFERLDGSCRIADVNTVGLAALSFFPGSRESLQLGQSGSMKI